MAGRAHVCFDRLLPRDLLRPHRVARDGRRVRAVSPVGKAWMNGSTLRVRFLGGTAAQRRTARTQAGWWTRHANLRFAFGDHPRAEIRVAFDPADGAWSYVGTDARSIPADQPTMNLGFLDGGTAAHEFGHAIGLAHEHQNPKGGLRWDERVVLRAMAGPPNHWDAATTRHNILRKYAVRQVRGTAFDPASIMLYFFPPTWTLDGVGTRANEVLSATDEAFVGGTRMYPRARPTVAQATALRVGAASRTAAAIGAFGEEDLFRFDATRGGRHVIDTRGPADLVLKLYGPTSPTALIAQDEDRGAGDAARLALDLLPGRYYVQVRHVNRAEGRGAYSIGVARG